MQEYKQFKKTSAQLSQGANSISSKGNTRDNDKNDGHSKVAKKLDKTSAVLRNRLSDIDTVKPFPPKAIKFDLAKSDNTNGYIHMQNLKFSYPNATTGLYIDDLNIHMGDKLYIRGLNGSGKTTLIKLITGKIIPDSGSIYIHPNIRIGYFAQMDHLMSSDMGLVEFVHSFDDFNTSEIVFTMKKLGFADEDITKTVNTPQSMIKIQTITSNPIFAKM